jgi:chromosome segregation ATPase
MDASNSENQIPHDESVPNDSGQPQQAVELPDNPEELKQAVHERDQKIQELRERNESLQEKLNQKEQVVQALTSRLEQAAEQLDRLRRSGADRGGKLLAGIPAEVIEEQKSLINDLKSTIKNWEELQSSSAMGRVETELQELRQMLAEQMAIKNKIDNKQPLSAGDSKAAPGKSAAPGKKSSWEQMKEQLLGQGGDKGASATPSIPSAQPEARIPGTESPESDQQPAQETREVPAIEIKPRPEPVEDLEQAKPETLRAAIEARDQHIDHLMNVIDTLREQSGAADMEQIKARQQELEEQLRKTEVEMAQERAQLARKEAELKKLEKSLSAQPGADKIKEASQKEEKSSRWSRFLGPG